jgi:leucyl aminopeptidase
MLGLGPTPKKKDDTEETKKEADSAGLGLGKAIATKCDSEKKITSCSVVLPEADDKVLQDLSTGFYQTLYSDNRYRTGAKKKYMAEELKTVSILVEAGEIGSGDALVLGKKIAQGVFMAKDIVNAPHNVLNSESLAETAKRIAKQSGGRLKCQVLGKSQCEDRGMGAYLGVARASETDPQFIHLTYTPPSGKVNRKVGVIGKGLLFDTGGYDIKTAMMGQMKFE